MTEIKKKKCHFCFLVIWFFAFECQKDGVTCIKSFFFAYDDVTINRLVVKAKLWLCNFINPFFYVNVIESLAFFQYLLLLTELLYLFNEKNCDTVMNDWELWFRCSWVQWSFWVRFFLCIFYPVDFPITQIKSCNWIVCGTFE